jgi:hypothetical protein
MRDPVKLEGLAAIVPDIKTQKGECVVCGTVVEDVEPCMVVDFLGKFLCTRKRRHLDPLHVATFSDPLGSPIHADHYVCAVWEE